MDDTILGENAMKRRPTTREKAKLDHTSHKGCSKEHVTGLGGHPGENCSRTQGRTLVLRREQSTLLNARKKK